MLQLPSALALFCEDIRQEKGGIVSLVGVLLDNINVEGVPGFAPKLAIYIRANFDPTQDLAPIWYELILPDGSVPVSDHVKREVLEKAQTESLRDGNPIASLVSRAIMSPFAIQQAGRMRVVVHFGDKEILAGSLNVKVTATTASSETSQPSEQSPDASQPIES